METTPSFGYWLRRRRKALDLTQARLAAQVGCTVAMIKKLESDARRPSHQLAERLAAGLVLPPDQRSAFLAVARAHHAPDQLPLDDQPIAAIGAALAPVSARRPPLPLQPTPLIGRADMDGGPSDVVGAGGGGRPQ